MTKDHLDGGVQRRERRSADGAYDELRPLLMSIAYRMVGSFSEAEDIVQEAFVRFHQATSRGTEVESVRAYLTAVTTRLGIDHLRSARVRRESYVGPWLPDPLVDELAPDVAQDAELTDSLSTAFLVLLETGFPRPIVGRDRVARLVAGTVHRMVQLGIRLQSIHVGGQPGALLLDQEDRVVGVWSLRIADGAIHTIHGVVNPDKLGHLGPTSPLTRRPRPDERTER